MRPGRTALSCAAYLFEIGQTYTTTEEYVYAEPYYSSPFAFRAITVPSGFRCDSFSVVPNLRVPKPYGCVCQYTTFWGLGTEAETVSGGNRA